MPVNRTYPIFLDLARRPVLIVGGGAVAARKAEGLLESGAVVTVVSLRFCDVLRGRKAIRRIRGGYAARHMKLKQWRLVFAATDSAAVNARVQKDAAAAGILCCRCDDPKEADFSNGAAAHLHGVTVAIGTSGASPALAKRLRDQAQAALDPALAQLAELFETWRGAAKARVADPVRRRLLLLRLAGEEMEAALRQKGPAKARRLFVSWLKEAGVADSPDMRSHRIPTRARTDVR